MSKMKSLALMLAVGMMVNESVVVPDDAKDIKATPKQPPIPKGCKEYFFNAQGEFSTERMRKDECVFICVASNDKNAKKKFNNWQKTQQP
jgi:hypothetical protein